MLMGIYSLLDPAVNRDSTLRRSKDKNGARKRPPNPVKPTGDNDVP
jgi:hypothetical protein